MVETGKRGKELWNLLRDTVKISTDLIKKADAQSSVITHGIHHERKLNHDDELRSVIYNTVTEEIITVDSQFIRVFYKDGRRKDITDPGESILTMIWSSKTNQYVAVTSDHEMKLLNSDLEFISTANFQHKICCLTYNESCNEVVSAGNGNVSSWCFRYGNKFLIPRKVITSGLTSQDEFNNLTLESTESKSQLCYATCGTGIAIFNLYEGKLIGHRRDLHVRNITSILFFNPLKYIITGSRDGSIKLWNKNFDVQHVFVGHHGSVEAIALYPLGPYFLSASNDCTIRLWNFNTYDEVDLLTTEDPVKGICTTLDFGYIFSFSSYTVDLWSVAHIHQIFTTIRCDTFSMQMVSPNKILPNRVICQCRDNTIRLISPTNGCVLTTLVPFWLIDRTEDDEEDFLDNIKLVDAVYCLQKENLFAAYDDGSLVKAWTATNPCRIQKVWKYEEGDRITCMCMYEYIVDSSELLATWEESKNTPKILKRLGLKTTSYGNKVILLGGTEDGCIANIDMQSGKVLFKTDAHGVKGVVAILANVKNDQVITAGKDNIVKVWKIFPNTVEALSLLMSFYCALTPCHMTIADSRLAVAFQHPESATYSMVMYDLTTKERYDHSPDEDHTDDLTGLTSSARLNFFASSSKDGTIRIWNQENSLIRMLKLNAEPQSLEYCSQRGDLLVSLNGNIHRIQHQSYLPTSYLFKMVCMEFSEQVNENPIGLDATLLGHLSEDTARCIKGAKSSHIKLDYTVDRMSEEELTIANASDQEKSEAYGLLSLRENELSGIRDGLVRPKRILRRATKKTESRAFQMYMRLFWRRPKKYNIKDADFSVDPPREVTKTPVQWHEEYKTGFFPPITSAKPMEEILNACDEKPKYYEESGPDFNPVTKYITNPNGFIPNSILTRFLWSQDDVAKQKAELIWKPPQFSQEQLEASKRLQLSLYDEPPTFEFGLATPSEDGAFKWEDDEVKEWDDEDEDSIDPSAGPAKEGTGKEPSKKPIAKKPSALLEKMRSAMKTPPPKSPSPPETPPPTKPADETPAVSAQPKPASSVPKKPHKAIVKLVSKPPPPKPKTPPPPTPTPPPTPPPATPPPPSFLTQFQGAPWFERYKDYIMQRLKRPYEASKFLLVVSDVLGIATDWDIRKSVVDALMMLWQKGDAKETRHLINSINSIFNSSNPPSPKDAEQAQFLRSALKLYHSLQGASDELVVELLTQYIEGDTLHQNFIRNLMAEVGLKDRHNYLGNELSSWNVWNLDPTSPQKAQIKKMVRNWMEDWTNKFKDHLNQIMEQLKQGDLKANIRKTPGTPKSVLKYPPDNLPSTAGSDRPRVHFTVQSTEQTLKNLSVIEVMNYFCEMMLEDELERKRLSTSGKPEPTKNTVLVLPKLVEPQALVRLGEMHTAHRARVRDKLAVEYRLNPLSRPYPDLMAGFTSKVILPVKIMHMNPFPSGIDKYERDNFYQPILLSLKSVHQKYFIPERSYVHLS